MSQRDYPVGKAQQMVLDALGLTATGFGDAERIFNEIGIAVASKREGRTSVPVVTNRQIAGGVGPDGEGWSHRVSKFDLTPIAQWFID